MDKFQIDITNLVKEYDNSKILLKGNEHRFVRVAFDLFRIDGDQTDDLWKVQSDDDGKEFLVRTYNVPEDIITSEWNVLNDKKYSNLTISFKGIPIIRIATKDFADENDGKTLQGIISKNLRNNSFIYSLIASLPKEKISYFKKAGLIDSLVDWLQSRDVTDPIIEKINNLVEESDPEYKNIEEKEEDEEWKLAFLNLHLLKSAHCGVCGQEANTGTYEDHFNELLDSFKSKYKVDSFKDLPEDAKKQLFEEADKSWVSKKEQGHTGGEKND